MQKINPADRQKVMLLGAAIVLVICLFSFTVVPRLLPHGPQGQLLVGGGSAPVAAASPSAPTITPANSVAATSPLLPPTDEIITIPVAPSASTDPFWRPLALSLQPPKSNFAPVKPVGLPPIGAGKMSPGIFGGRSGPGTPLAAIPPPPMPDVSLQGIVQDGTAMAVLQVGGQARFLKAGEKLMGDWYIAEIQTATVILKQGKREVTLTLGQTLQKDPPPLPAETRDLRGLATTLPPFHNVTLEP
ncbi:MAG: hypothetical protein JWN14_4193 [Chthonomonadales bacterium]|nr:hypothetical protein [Chthonomonadales bacterium]